MQLRPWPQAGGALAGGGITNSGVILTLSEPRLTRVEGVALTVSIREVGGGATLDRHKGQSNLETFIGDLLSSRCPELFVRPPAEQIRLPVKGAMKGDAKAAAVDSTKPSSMSWALFRDDQ